MTISDINSFVTLRTGADTNAFTAAQRLISTNRWQNKILTMVLQSMDEWDFDDSVITSTYPTATRALVAGRRDYAFSTAAWSLIGKEGGSAGANAAINPLKIKRVDITYDGTNYYKAEPFDANETGLGLGNDTTTDARFSKNQPVYDIRDNAIWIYPMGDATDVANSAKIRVTLVREMTDFTSSDVSTGTKEPSFDEPFHVMIALGMAYDWFMGKADDRANKTWQELMDYEKRLREHYGTKQKDRVYTLTAAYENYD